MTTPRAGVTTFDVLRPNQHGIDTALPIMVGYYYTPGLPAQGFNPPEPASVEIIFTRDRFGVPVKLTDTELDFITTRIRENRP